jgi:Streptomyces sporulation and cell division protein, SsgA
LPSRLCFTKAAPTRSTGSSRAICSRPAWTGDGDVVVWPTQDRQARPAVHLRLRSPSGDALLEAPADSVAEFLTETARLVPPGTEYQHVDIDAALESLLGEI